MPLATLRYCASGLLAAGAALSISSMASMDWWAGHAATEHVTYDMRFSLWGRTSTKYVNNPIDHGLECTSSDECRAGTWCTLGPKKCWTDGDCKWTSFLSHSSTDCARMPRTQLHATWLQLCSASASEGLPCKTVGLVLILVSASALLAVVASPSAILAARSPTWAAAASTCLGSAGGLVAMLLEFPHARATGLGLALHWAGMAFVAAGCLAAARAPRQVEPEGQGKDRRISTTTTYGKVAQEEDEEPVSETIVAATPEAEEEDEEVKFLADEEQAKRGGEAAEEEEGEEGTTTLLQRLHAVRPVDGRKAPSMHGEQEDPKTPKMADKHAPAEARQAAFGGAGVLVDDL